MRVEWAARASRKSLWVLAGCLFIALGWALAQGVATVYAQAPNAVATQPMASAPTGLPDFRSLVRDNQASVVNIFTSRTERPRFQGFQDRRGPWDDLPQDSPFREYFKRFGPGAPRDQETRSLGSGFIVSSDGKILTNAHVVDGADEIKVKLADRTEKIAKLLGIDKATDVALLKIDAKNLPTVKFGDSDQLVVGEWVLAIGSPFSLEYTATHGIVSAIGRRLDSNYVPFIQTDVPVNPGNSGGPLFNMRGEVVGINSQIYSRTGGYMGLSFAIPINIARNVEQQLEEHGRVTRGWLGVAIQSVNNDLAKSFGLDKPTGALVGDVVEKGPAAKAGVKSGDIILSFNDHMIADSADLPPLVAATAIGRAVPLKILRDGKQLKLDVKVAALPDDKPGAVENAREESEDKALLNISVAHVPDELRKQIGLKSGGVLVQDVRSGPAERAGIESGDVILKMDGKEIVDAAQFVKLVKGLPRGKPIAVLVRKRQGGQSFTTVMLPEE